MQKDSSWPRERKRKPRQRISFQTHRRTSMSPLLLLLQGKIVMANEFENVIERKEDDVEAHKSPKIRTQSRKQ
ncbi:hypothetical protein L484_001384 [Morus notabilis]|uniref:Uncharacterized protein n=1 Tax=Morus notabilis TaxID=981085 RepID=W9R1J2_9ROSA|nr:hypothetical protein L484_001384 [Morus notabilis]